MQKAWHHVLRTLSAGIGRSADTIAATSQPCAPYLGDPSTDEQRKDRAAAMAEEYVRHYFWTSHLVRVATKERWAEPLYDYVAEMAWVQAQGICQVCPIEESDCLSETLRHCDSTDDTFERYRESVGDAVKRSQVRVSIPPFCIQKWREAHQRQGQITEVPAEGRRTR